MRPKSCISYTFIRLNILEFYIVFPKVFSLFDKNGWKFSVAVFFITRNYVDSLEVVQRNFLVICLRSTMGSSYLINAFGEFYSFCYKRKSSYSSSSKICLLADLLVDEIFNEPGFEQYDICRRFWKLYQSSLLYFKFHLQTGWYTQQWSKARFSKFYINNSYPK